MGIFLRKSVPRSLKPFKSPAAALRWYEWRTRGKILYANILCAVIVVFLGLVFFQDPVMSAATLLMLLIFMCITTSVLLSMRNYQAWHTGAIAFVLIRPVHPSSYAYARIRPLIIYCLFLTILTGLPPFLDWAVGFTCERETTNLDGFLKMLLTGGSICWLSYWSFSRINLLCLSAVSIIMFIVLSDYGAVQNDFMDKYVPLWAGIISIGLILGLVYSYIRAWRKKVINWEILIILLSVWLLFGSMPFFVHNRVFPPYERYDFLLWGTAPLALIFEPMVSTPLTWHRKRSGGGKPLPLISFPLSHQRISHYRLAIGLFFVMLFIGGLLFRGYAAFRLHQELAALQDNPYLRQENLKVIYPDVPPKNNAAIKYQTACYRIRNIYQQHPPEGYESPSNHLHWIFRENNDELLDNDYLKKLREEVQLYNDVFEPLEQAASLEQSQFQENIEQKESFIYLGLLHHAHNLLLAKVILAIDDEEIDEAIKNLHITSALFRATRHEPGFTINAYSKNISNDICSAIRFMLSHLLLSDQQLEDLQIALEESNFSSGVLTAFCVEFHWQWAEYNKEILTVFPLSKDDSDPPPDHIGAWYRWSGMHDLERAAFLKRMNWLSQKISWDYPQTFDDYPLTDENTTALQGWGKWWTRIKNDLERRAYTDREWEAYALARQHMAYAALAIERYHLLHSQIPDSLWDLEEQYTCGSLQDPFGKRGSEEELQPCPKEKAFLAAMRPLLKYKRCGDGYFLYTVGTNRIDDKGKSFLRFDEKDNTSDDYRFSVHCPEVEVREMGEQYFKRHWQLKSFGAF
ncbi:MAG TPA: hypothetical protein PLI09_13035 [Candidatus Hydrogenedentes bacterium]|nr:hypothetical protein [Candidatus Hydrogenedentota bacterium]